MIHRDIKPQNLMLTNCLPSCEEVTDPTAENIRQNGESSDCEFRLKIADFGFARHLNTSSLADTLCGSPLYMAPEILQHQRYDAKADLWSTGTVLFEMLTGKPPFGGENHMDLLRNIQRKAVRLPQDVRVSSECVNLLKILLHRNPMRRATFEQFFQACETFVALGCNGKSPANENEAGASCVRPMTTTTTGLHCIQEQDTIMDDTGGSSDNPVVTPTMEPRQHSDVIPIPSITHGKLQGVSHFAPLIASPSTLSLKSPPSALIPTPFSLGPQALSPPCASPENRLNLCPLSSAKSVTSSIRSTHAGNVVSSSSSTEEFVMVQSPSKNISTWAQQRQQPPLHLYNTNQKQISSNVTKAGYYNGIGSIRKSGSNFLSTSPGTGQALLTAMYVHNGESHVRSSNIGSNKSHAFVSFGAAERANNGAQSTANRTALAANMLAAAEDVGRRSVNVAHVGDTRAYIAMRLLVSNNALNTTSATSSTCCPIPMEGVIEESSSLFDTPPSVPFSCDINENIRESVRRVSSTSDHGAFDMDDEDDMPFASSISRGLPTEGCPVHNSSLHNRASSIFLQQHALVYSNLREALSCYIKALKLMKGAVHAAQRVIDVLSSLTNSETKLETQSVSLMERCKVSLKWLGEQFHGVLERADATKAQLERIKSKHPEAIRFQEQQCAQLHQNTTKLLPSVSISLNGHDMALVPLSAEELIYNHAMACGKDGAVKHLLGQTDAAKASYKSAGLLIEALLMEPNLPQDDRKLLEGYMHGFKERIAGLRKVGVTSQGNSRRQTR